MFPSLRGRVDARVLRAARGALARLRRGVLRDAERRRDERRARGCVDAGVRIVDLAADFRSRTSPSGSSGTSSTHAAPELVARGGLRPAGDEPRAIRDARGSSANPGCYPTAVQLGFLPLVEAASVDLEHLIADAKSGVSGAGRKTELHAHVREASDNFTAYNVAGHRHWPEIRAGARAGSPARPVGARVRPAPDADDPRHPRDALRADHAGGGFPGALREALRGRAVRRRAAGRQPSRHALGARREHLPHRRPPAARTATRWSCSRSSTTW